MYTDWFKLRKLPFRLRPDPEFLYLADEAGRVYRALRAAVTGEYRVVCLLGESGVGKTTLLHALAQECQGSMSVARVQQPNLTPEELASTLAEQFNLPPEDQAPRDAVSLLTRFASEAAGRGRTVVILVDEAHHCSAVLLRKLLLFATRTPAPLIVLAGDATLRNSLTHLDLQDSATPPIQSMELPRLTMAQISGYLDYRLNIAGNDGRRLFDPETIAEIWRYTGGTPQLINTLCDSAMMLAEAHSMPRVGVVEIREAVQELNWVEFSARNISPAPIESPGFSGPVPAAHANSLALEVRCNDQFVRRMVLVPGCLVVGRDADVGLRLNSRFISRRHCQLVTTADQSIIEDLGSANGILVNGSRIHRHRLSPGDKIEMGDYTLTCLETAAT